MDEQKETKSAAKASTAKLVINKEFLRNPLCQLMLASSNDVVRGIMFETLGRLRALALNEDGWYKRSTVKFARGVLEDIYADTTEKAEWRAEV